jgi:hypothetical protein
MTEGEWVTTKLPLYMLREYPHEWDLRKVRLFWCGCVRRVWELVTDERTRRLVALMEADPGHVVPETEVEAIRHHLNTEQPGYRYCTDTRHPDYWALGALLDPPPGPLTALTALAVGAADRVAGNGGLVTGLPRGSSNSWRQRCDDAETAEKHWQCDLLREIFGNPFRPVCAELAWLTSDVLALARGIYDDKAFDRMPILADALQDAGCDNVNVLDHCREEREHVRGCWVIDMLLGKG